MRTRCLWSVVLSLDEDESLVILKSLSRDEDSGDVHAPLTWTLRCSRAFSCSPGAADCSSLSFESKLHRDESVRASVYETMSRPDETLGMQLSLRLQSTYAQCRGRPTESPMSALPVHCFATRPTNPVRSPSPRRVLTKKTEPQGNGGLDNEERNLIVRERDVLGGRRASPPQAEYIVLDLLGQGTFGQVFRCQNAVTKEIVAVKVIRNHPSYYKQAIVEVQITGMLNASYTAEEAPHMARLKGHFEYCNHLCLVFELLGINVYELIADNNFNGFSLDTTRGFLQQILHALVQLEDVGVIHCDLKPENILLAGSNALLSDIVYDRRYPSPFTLPSDHELEIPHLKVVDFGSACMENETVYSYIQSRFYRSPEVLLGIPYSGSIDLWSLGCIAVEMFLGLPLFPGVSEHDQLRLIEETLGILPQHLLRRGRHVLKFYNLRRDQTFVLKSPEEFAEENKSEVQISKKYFKHSKLYDMIHAYPLPKDASPVQIAHECERRDALLHFLGGVLRVDPDIRWTARDAVLHPFITGQRFDPSGGYVHRPMVAPLPRAPYQPLGSNHHHAEFHEYSGMVWGPPGIPPYGLHPPPIPESFGPPVKAYSKVLPLSERQQSYGRYDPYASSYEGANGPGSYYDSGLYVTPPASVPNHPRYPKVAPVQQPPSFPRLHIPVLPRLTSNETDGGYDANQYGNPPYQGTAPRVLTTKRLQEHGFQLSLSHAPAAKSQENRTSHTSQDAQPDVWVRKTQWQQ
ncbi:hypothetical protein Poli38472_004256 [Pythium oligandrum]|uniref:Protein kinase domain-containing protein n=1 Tax=Pythium oligandrum TaxID=41045 RepID=A0A8K1CPS7_PYTOL|nr:hypothetical protein Poli38472_004256 [Pythium oligandrum]|eukprot:TMW66491.1 hypothetical protein Poli38472_004256 [Pythium oligandrum]